MLCCRCYDVGCRGDGVLQEAAVFLFEKRVADKLHKPKRREVVTELLRREAARHAQCVKLSCGPRSVQC